MSQCLETLQSISVIAASLAALWGIGAWRREYHGRRRIELAEEVLELFYRAKDAICHIRRPYGLPGEGSSQQPEKNGTESGGQTPDPTSAIVVERYDGHMEVFNRLHALRYRFMALEGKDKVRPFADLTKVANQILLNAGLRATLLRQGFPRQPDHAESYRKHLEEAESVIWQRDEDDPIAKEVDRIVEDAESICRPIIENRGWWDWIKRTDTRSKEPDHV